MIAIIRVRDHEPDGAGRRSIKSVHYEVERAPRLGETGTAWYQYVLQTGKYLGSSTSP